MSVTKTFLGTFLGIVILLGCSKEVEDQGPPAKPDPYVKVIFEFTFDVNGAPLERDTVKYENASGNIYSVHDLRFLIGKIRLDTWGQTEKTFIDEYHLVEILDNSTLTFSPKDTILAGDYQSITLFMGFEDSKNKTGNYRDLDEKGWGWDPNLGGGYYTLQMNDGYFYPNGGSASLLPYDLAVGGKIRRETPTDTAYVANDKIYASMTEGGGFEIPLGTKVVKIEISMDVNKLFKDKAGFANYNFVTHQTNIEYDAIGSQILSENLANCFRLRSVTYDDEATGD